MSNRQRFYYARASSILSSRSLLEKKRNSITWFWSHENWFPCWICGQDKASHRGGRRICREYGIWIRPYILKDLTMKHLKMTRAACVLCLMSWAAAADNEPTPGKPHAADPCCTAHVCSTQTFDQSVLILGAADWVQEKLAKAEKAESNRAKIPHLYHADIFVYDSTTENCSGEPSSIGGCIPTDQVL